VGDIGGFDYNEIYEGDAKNLLEFLPDESVDCVITSPPYWGLRDYGIEPLVWDGKVDCQHEWGKEIPGAGKNNDQTAGEKQKTVHGSINRDNRPPSQFCQFCGAWRGSLGLEPTYQLYLDHLMQIFGEVKRVLKKTGTCWVNLGDTYNNSPSNQSPNLGNAAALKKIGRQARTQKIIPTKSLVGISERFAIRMTDELGWIRRNTIIWHKRNCMPSSASDRFTVDFEYVYFFTKSGKYWFEQQKEPYTAPMNRWGGDKLKADGESTWDNGTGQDTYRDRDMRPDKDGRNRRCVWDIPTKPFSGAHFAVFPTALVEPCILAGCPVAGVVLDPFAGSGTVRLVALNNGRLSLGFEIKKEYIDIADKRLETGK
jgi:site-specific DNA-methyltransferase (cytosine-N4-specific)